MTEPRAAERTDPASGPRTPEQIALLYATEQEVIARLSSCVADLNAARAAKHELANLGAAEVRLALEHRRRSLREAQ